MPLHPVAQAILDMYRDLPPLEEIGVDAGREQAIELARRAPPGPPVFCVEDRVAHCANADLPVRIYRPAGPGPFPVLVYFHGGGFVIGNLETCDASCRMLASTAGCVVVSVNYRHAPEHKFPTAVEDAYAATVWVAQNLHGFSGDAHRLAVGGASAGGTLAAVTTLIARERGFPAIAFQLLLVPATDLVHDFPSYAQYEAGFGLNRATMRWFGQQYLNGPDDLRHPHASPLRAGNLSGLPPASIMTAEFDPLRDEGAAYAEALRAAGVPVSYKCCAGMIHLRLGPEADEDMARDLRAAFGA